jgi:hypothetical protein
MKAISGLGGSLIECLRPAHIVATAPPGSVPHLSFAHLAMRRGQGQPNLLEGLQMRSKSLLFAVFVAGLIMQSAFAQSQSLLPHVVNGLFPGGSFRTTFVIVNNTDSTATVVLALTNGSGEPLEVTIPGLGTESTFTLSLSPGATRILQTDGSGTLVSGAATVTSSVPVGASAVVTVFDPEGNFLTEAGVGDSPALLQFTFPVQVSRSLNTGIALYNPSTSAVTLSLRLLDRDGTVAGTTQLVLSPKNHTARFASELFPIADLMGGSIAVTGTGNIASLVMRQNLSGGKPTYTNLPVTSGVFRGTNEVTKTMIGATPMQISGLTGVMAVTDGAILKNDGTVWALRAAYDADSNKAVSLTTTQIDGLTGVAAVSGRMALKSNGTVWDFSDLQPTKVNGLSDIVAIHQSAGGVVALKRDGTVWTSGYIQGPFEVREARGAVAVAELAFGGLALMNDGTVWEFGLMGEGSDSYLSYWGQFDGVVGIVAIDAMYDVALGLKSDGTVWDLFHSVSTKVQGIPGAVGISAGYRHHMALAQDGTVWEWGHDYLGLGNTVKTTWPTPRQVPGLTGVVKIAAGWYHSLALLSDGTVWVWGYK